jgi:lipoate-protein ligase A
VTGSWSVERLTGSATELHSRELPDPVDRAAWVLEATAPALVLGSAQPSIEVAGLEVCRRRSGGGAVLVRPAEVLWIDVLLPRGDPLWDDDVGRAPHWLGDTWRDALGDGVVHTGEMIHSHWSSAICFAGIGPGEVLMGGAKVVGISQRRTRAGARFQCVVLRTWDPSELARIFAPGEWREVADRLNGVAFGVADLAGLEAAFLAALTSR